MPQHTPHDDPWADLYADLGVTEQIVPQANTDYAQVIATNDEFPASSELNVKTEEELLEEDTEQEIDENGISKRRKRRRRKRSKAKNEENHQQDFFQTTDDAVDSELVDSVDEEAPIEDVESASDTTIEGGTSEMTRELIATWNVPSWEEIVAGLYRPQR